MVVFSKVTALLTTSLLASSTQPSTAKSIRGAVGTEAEPESIDERSMVVFPEKDMKGIDPLVSYGMWARPSKTLAALTNVKDTKSATRELQSEIGSEKRGAVIFRAQCARCHAIGPNNLKAISAMDGKTRRVSEHRIENSEHENSKHSYPALLNHFDS